MRRREEVAALKFWFVSALYNVTFVFCLSIDNIMLRDVSLCVRVYG